MRSGMVAAMTDRSQDGCHEHRGGVAAAGRPFTVADLDRMPDDGHRYELLDGALVVSPRPTNPHQEVAMELAVRLRSACPRDLRVIPEPAVQLAATTEFAPGHRGHPP